jgi:hypothetical protein
VNYMIELRLARIEDHQSRLRASRDAERASPGRHPLRARLGESLLRLGERLAGGHLPSPASTG